MAEAPLTQMRTENIEMGYGSAVAEHAHDHRPMPKWAAVVGDRPFPMPRRTLTAQTVKDLAGVGEAFVLVLDYESRNDVVLADETELDLAKGNVFRVIPRCEAAEMPECHDPAKLAWFVDDEWELTLLPKQTEETLRRLFEIPADLELLRDFQSPHDEIITDTEAVLFGDGPVFRTERTSITVKVNNHPVTFHRRRVTGLEIKETAITQGVAISKDGVLYAMKPDGELGPVIRDNERVTLRSCEEFRCVTPDDNS
jgi:hypothetical protein